MSNRTLQGPYQVVLREFFPYGEEATMSKAVTTGHSLLSTTGLADAVELVELSGICEPFEEFHMFYVPLYLLGEEVCQDQVLQRLYDPFIVLV